MQEFLLKNIQITSSELGLPNGNSSIRNIIDSVYNISINQYYLGTLAFSYLGMLVFTMIIVLISILARNVILEIILPIILYFLPTLIKPDCSKNFWNSRIKLAAIAWEIASAKFVTTASLLARAPATVSGSI